MNFLIPITLVVAAYLAVFFEASLARFNELIGTSIKLLPGLMVYCGLNCGAAPIASVAVFGGFWMDTLSANPLGVSVLPLFLIGLAVHHSRDLILREQPYAHFVLGATANLAFPLFTLSLLWLTGRRPLFGLTSFLPLALGALLGGASTVLFFRLFDRIKNALSYKTLPESTFRPDREIKRGRA